MNNKWRFNRFRDPLGMMGVVVLWLLFQNLSFCWSLNDEGMEIELMGFWCFGIVALVLGKVKENG